MKLRLVISYDGSGYCGWQSQKNGRSVQEVLTGAASGLYGRDCLVTGCSRTDSGVHAREYSCTVEFADAGGVGICELIDPASVPRALNSRLPDDIAVSAAFAVADGFHARYDVKSKTYEYVMYDSPERTPFLRGRAHHIRPLDAEMTARMAAAAAAMTGKRDYAVFMASGSKIRDTVRNVGECAVFRDGGLLIFRVSADGFLYKMVRTMAGTALAAAYGRIDPDDIGDIIASGDKKRVGATLPAYGLYLCRVEY